jgi:DNA-binding phage protein
VAERAGIARATLYKAERGDPGVTLGTYVRILATLGMEKDFELLASDDKVGRTLQDLALTPVSKRPSATLKVSQP